MFDRDTRITSFAVVFATALTSAATLFANTANAQSGRANAPSCSEMPAGYQGQCIDDSFPLGIQAQSGTKADAPYCDQMPAGYQGQCQQRTDLILPPSQSPQPAQQGGGQYRFACSGGEQFSLSEANGGINVWPPGESQSIFLQEAGSENGQDFYSDYSEITIIHETQSGVVHVQSYDGTETYLANCQPM